MLVDAKTNLVYSFWLGVHGIIFLTLKGHPLFSKLHNYIRILALLIVGTEITILMNNYTE